MSQDNVVGNTYDKYNSRNSIARRLMDRFLQDVTELYTSVKPEKVLEVGCGEGMLSHHLITQGFRPKTFDACDLSLAHLSKGLDKDISFQEASIFELPFPDRYFDLVVCCEVLEHIDDPLEGLNELARVSKKAVIISTPWEPVWCMMNIARGKYLRHLGNTPGHIQHFSRKGLIQLSRQKLTHLNIKTPLPWTIILGQVRHG